MDLSDSEWYWSWLIARAKHGNSQARDELIKRLSRDIESYFWRELRENERADALQRWRIDFGCRGIHNATASTRQGLRAYCIRIARNIAYDARSMRTDDLPLNADLSYVDPGGLPTDEPLIQRLLTGIANPVDGREAAVATTLVLYHEKCRLNELLFETGNFVINFTALGKAAGLSPHNAEQGFRILFPEWPRETDKRNPDTRAATTRSNLANPRSNELNNLTNVSPRPAEETSDETTETQPVATSEKS